MKKKEKEKEMKIKTKTKRRRKQGIERKIRRRYGEGEWR